MLSGKVFTREVFTCKILARKVLARSFTSMAILSADDSAKSHKFLIDPLISAVNLLDVVYRAGASGT